LISSLRLLVEILLALCLLGSWAYYLMCLDGARRWQAKMRKWEDEEIPSRRPAPDHPSAISPFPLFPITILKPLRGSDPEQYASFQSFCRLDYPEYQIVFGALAPDDPGLEAARRLAREFPERDIAVVAGGEAFGLNRKVCNLEHMLRAAKHDLLTLCDSDMRVEPDYLRRVAAPFADPDAGIVTCLYRGCRARGLASALEALGIGADFAPSVLAAYRLEGLSFAFGSTIVIRRETLEAVGRFRALADELADDYLLGYRVKGLGKKVILSDYVVDDVLGSETLREMWARRLRWAKTMRAMRPGGWAGAFLTHGTVLALLFLLATGLRPAGWAGFGLTLGLRAFTATWIARRCTRDGNLPRLLPLLPLSDLLAFALWAASFFGNRIVWRGERFRLGKGGRLYREGE
jgi:ceramide glucosyltransferase